MEPFSARVIIRPIVSITTDIIPANGTLVIGADGTFTLTRGEEILVRKPFRELKSVQITGGPNQYAHSAAKIYIGVNQAYEVSFMPLSDSPATEAADMLDTLTKDGLKAASVEFKKNGINFTGDTTAAYAEATKLRSQFIKLAKQAGIYKSYLLSASGVVFLLIFIVVASLIVFVFFSQK